MTRKLNQQSGFTLLELLMVVIIVGILATLALPAYIRASEKARTAEVVTMLGALKNSIQRFCADSEGTMPADFTKLDVDDPTTIVGLSTRWNWPPAIGGPVAAQSGSGVGGVCSAGGAAFQFSASIARAIGPCAGSTVDMDINAVPPAPVNSIFWQGQCI